MEPAMRGAFVKSPWSLTLAAFVTAKKTHRDARPLQSWSLSRAQKPPPVCACWENWWVWLTEIQQLKMLPVSERDTVLWGQRICQKTPIFLKTDCVFKKKFYLFAPKNILETKQTNKTSPNHQCFAHVFYRVIEQFGLKWTLKFF